MVVTVVISLKETETMGVAGEEANRNGTSKHTYCVVPNLRQHWLEVKRTPLNHRKTMLVTAKLTWMLAIWRVYPKCR